MIDQYDPEIAPEANEWLALDEDERLELVREYHRRAKIPLPKAARELHAAIHAVVENQLAMNEPAVVRTTLSRLIEEGLTRHEAVHAVGSVLIEHMYNLMGHKKVSADMHAPYSTALKQLTAEKWRNSAAE